MRDLANSYLVVLMRMGMRVVRHVGTGLEQAGRQFLEIAMQRETNVLRNIVKAVEHEHPNAWIHKWADRFTRGMPDLVIVLQGGRVFFVEVKRPGGAESKLQKHNAKLVRTLGGRWIVATCPAEVLEAIDETERAQP